MFHRATIPRLENGGKPGSQLPDSTIVRRANAPVAVCPPLVFGYGDAAIQQHLLQAGELNGT
jgi:hypothetical protein